MVIEPSSRCSKQPEDVPVLFLTSRRSCGWRCGLWEMICGTFGVSSSGPDLNLAVLFATHSQWSWSSCVRVEQCFQSTQWYRFLNQAAGAGLLGAGKLDFQYTSQVILLLSMLSGTALQVIGQKGFSGQRMGFHEKDRLRERECFICSVGPRAVSSFWIFQY